MERMSVECAECGFENPESNKFCGECGRPLTSLCPDCGTANPPLQKFCGECGNALTLQSGEAASDVDPGERRFVSVLFADLVGFTAFSEKRDPEEVRALLTRYFDRARETVERFGGEVDKFIGDAVTAFWGATRAQDDDAERAVRAALELVDTVAELGDELGVPGLRLRAGVLSGETSVGSGGNQKGLVVGDIVNTASRLQAAADPGTVLVGEATKALTEEAIQYEAAGEHEFKGKSLPVGAWRALHVAGAVGGRGRSSGLEAPFVGRTNELRLLKDQVHATSSDGNARLVSIVGEAGIGKTRLAWEFQKYLDGLTEVFRWHQGRSPAYGSGVTLWALGEMVRSRSGITEGEDSRKARTKLRTAVAEHISDSEERDWIEPRLAALLGLDANPSGDRSELFSAIRTFFQRLAEEATTILVFEDLHWADDSQLDFIEELVEMSRALPILVVTLARPELLERRPGWGSARRNFLSVHLGPLGDEEMTQLVEGLAPGIPEDVVSLIVGHAAGVPLYAVEYVRTLVNAGDLVREGSEYRAKQGLSKLEVPDSLHSVIGARLDRLAPDERSLVQDAAILGQSFTLEGLTALTGRSGGELEPQLRDLVRRELLQLETDPRSPERGQYQFVQSLIREVAYGRIAKTDRRDRHVKVADYFHSVAPIEAAVVVASHYLDAYQADPDDELAAKARGALMDAARRAADLYSDAQALDLASRALEVPATEAEQAPIWLFSVRPATSLFELDLAIDYATKALDWYRDHGTPDEVIRAAATLGFAHLGRETPTDAIAAMQPFYDPSRLDEPEMRLLGSELARCHMLAQDDLALAAQIAGHVLSAAEAADDMEMVVEAMNTRGTAIGIGGSFNESIALLREAVRLGDAHDLLPATMRAINNLCVMGWVNGLTSVQEHGERGYELAQRLGRYEFVTRMLLHRVSGMLEEGAFREALDLVNSTDIGQDEIWSASFKAVRGMLEWHLTGALEPLETGREALLDLDLLDEPQMRASMSDWDSWLSYLAGDAERALEVASEALPDTLPAYELQATAIKAALELRQPEALSAIQEAIGIAKGRRGKSFAIAAEAVRAALLGEDGEAVLLFEELIDLVSEIEGSLSLAIWRAEMGRALPGRSEAQQAATEAHAWFTSVGDKGYLGRYDDVWRIHLPQEAVRAG